jgi:transcriptional regulator with GAF, ATPase, and Fis domain
VMDGQQFFLRKISDEDGNRYLLRDPIFCIGRLPENDIAIKSRSLPDVAAQIELRAGEYVLSAIGNSAVFVNGKKKKTAILKRADRIKIATTEFLFDCTDECPVESDQNGVQKILDSIYRFIGSVGRERDVAVLLRKIIDTLITLIGGTDAFIFTLDSHNKPEVFVSSCEQSEHDRFSDTIVQEVLQRGRGIVIPNALETHEFNQSQSIAELHLMSVLCCPILVAGAVRGAIYIGTKKTTESFSEADLKTLDLYATIAGMLINHVDYIVHQSNAIKQLTGYHDRGGIVAESKIMQDIFTKVDAMNRSAITILLEGETGTGKDLLARYIHNTGPRKAGPFIVVNCCSLQSDLIESELFGHKKGSFTGAVGDHEGLFIAADGGTLFMDEIGEMNQNLQAKLLRVLENGVIRQVGASLEKKVDVRIICATNRTLNSMVAEGSFRKDLYYRINQMTITLPPLKERGEDCVLIAYYFLEKFKSENPSQNIIDFHPDSIRFISSYDWPGNVRELAGAVRCAVLSATGPFVTVEIGGKITRNFDFETATLNFQKRLIDSAIRASFNNKEQAARLLGLSRSTFFRYLFAIKENGADE